MEIVNLGKFRRFSREKPNRLGVFDRPRLVCDLICLEPGQEERRRYNSASDELYVVLEGQAHLRTAVQEADLEELDAALVPPGVEHSIANRGGGRLTVMALVAPKPARASEVRTPPERRSRGSTSPSRQARGGSQRPGPPDRTSGRPGGRPPRRGPKRGPEGGPRAPASAKQTPAPGRSAPRGRVEANARGGRPRQPGPATRSARPVQGRSGPRTLRRPRAP